MSEPWPPSPKEPPQGVDAVCPVCGGALETQSCKVVCTKCRHLVFNCSEF